MSEPYAVLIVNGKSYMRELLLAALDYRYDCATASGVDDSLALIESRSFDLIITEAAGPDCSGLVVLLHARRACPGAAVIVLTGENDREFKRFAVENGAFGFLPTPFTAGRLEATVQGALNGRPPLGATRA